MSTTWILVANASEAHLYSSPKAKLFNGDSTLSTVKDYTHPASRQKNRDLIDTKSGYHQTLGGGGGTFVGSGDPHDTEMEIFARELIRELNQHFHKHDFNDLIVAAPPQFHGKLNKYVNSQLNGINVLNIDKDYTKFDGKSLAALLKDYL